MSAPRPRRNRRLGIAAAMALAVSIAGSPVLASTLYLSTNQAAGPSANNQFGNGEVFEVDLLDPPFSPGSPTFDEANFVDGNANVNAFALRPDGITYLVSTQGNETVGSVDARRRNVFAWNSLTDTATLFLDGTTLPGNGAANIDAIHELTNGNLLFSTVNNRDLWDDGDIVEYNPSATDTVDGLAPQTSRIVVSEADFGQNVDVDGISVNTGGNLLVSFANGNVTLDGNTYRDEDVFEILGVGSYQMFFDGSARLTDDGQDVNAFAYVPEPRSALFMLLGLAGLARAGRPRP